MLALFRTNQQLVSSLLIFYAVLVRFWATFSPIAPPVGNGSLLSDWMFQLTEGQPQLSLLVATLLLFVQAFLINKLVIDHRLSASVNQFPGLFYLLIASSLPEFLYLSPLHLANTFYIFAILAIMPIYKRAEQAGQIFNAGLFIGLAGICYGSYILFAGFGLISLLLLRAFRFREWLMLLSGIFLPYFFAWLWYFWRDRPTDFFHQIQADLAWFDWPPLQDSWLVYFGLGLFALLVLTALFNRANYIFKTKMQVQRKITVLYYAMLVSALTPLIQANLGMDHLLVLAIPLGIFMGLSFTRMSATLAEGLHFIWLAAVSLVHYLVFIL